MDVKLKSFPINLSVQQTNSDSKHFEHFYIRNINLTKIFAFLRTLFKCYWRKPFYKFLQFNLVHWPLAPSIKWVIELWFTYIQPSKFSIVSNTPSGQLNLITQFIKENYLVYVDIYQLIIKRYCIVDFSIEENIQLMNQILTVCYWLFLLNEKLFNEIILFFQIFAKQKDEIKKCDLMFSNAQYQILQYSKQDVQHLLRNNSEIRYVYNLLADLEKPVHLFKPLIGVESLKLVNIFSF